MHFCFTREPLNSIKIRIWITVQLFIEFIYGLAYFGSYWIIVPCDGLSFYILLFDCLYFPILRKYQLFRSPNSTHFCTHEAYIFICFRSFIRRFQLTWKVWNKMHWLLGLNDLNIHDLNWSKEPCVSHIHPGNPNSRLVHSKLRRFQWMKLKPFNFPMSTR